MQIRQITDVTKKTMKQKNKKTKKKNIASFYCCESLHPAYNNLCHSTRSDVTLCVRLHNFCFWQCPTYNPTTIPTLNPITNPTYVPSNSPTPNPSLVFCFFFCFCFCFYFFFFETSVFGRVKGKKGGTSYVRLGKKLCVSVYCCCV